MFSKVNFYSSLIYILIGIFLCLKAIIIVIMEAICWVEAITKKEDNVPFTIPSDVFVDVFSFCSRNDLDCIQLVSKRFDTIVKTSFKKYPIRAIYAVLVDKPVDLGENLTTDPTTIIYAKDSQLRREFKSLEDLLVLHEKQNAVFLHLSIYQKDMDMDKVKKKHLSLTSKCPIDLPALFCCQQPFYQLTPQFQPPSFNSSFYYSYRISIQFFNSRSVEFEFPIKRDVSYHLSVPDMLTWFAFNNVGRNDVKPKFFKSNFYLFVESLDVFIDTFFEGFESQNQQCQYEIVVIDLQDINVSASEIDKTAKNYVTNEVVESIFLKDSPDDLLRKKYNNADWVLRRRLCSNLEFPVAFDKSVARKQSVGGVDSSEILYAVWFE